MQLVAAMIAFVAVLWWVAAPVIVTASDTRLRRRNPDHHRRLVRFYRAWGIVAIAVGIAVSVVAR